VSIIRFVAKATLEQMRSFLSEIGIEVSRQTVHSFLKKERKQLTKKGL
jgi:hypothetical protein